MLSIFLKKGSLYFIGNMISRLTMMLINIASAQLLNQNTYGQFTMIRNTVSVIEGFISATLAPVVIKYISKYDNRSNYLSNIIFISFIINIVFIIFILIGIFLFKDYLIREIFLNSLAIQSSFIFILLLLIATAMSTWIQSCIIGYEAYKVNIKYSFISSIVTFPIIVVLIHIYDLNGAMLGIIIYFSLDFILKVIYIFKTSGKINIDFLVFFEIVKTILEGTQKLFLASILTLLSLWYARVLVINNTSSFINIAIFDAAFQWLTVIIVLSGAITNITLPILSKSLEKNKILYINLLISIIIATIVAIIIIIYASNIMMLYGKDYLIGQDALCILSITAVMYTVQKVFLSYNISKNNYSIILNINILSICIMFSVLVYLIDLKELALSWSLFAYYGIATVLYSLEFLLNKGKKINDLSEE